MATVHIVLARVKARNRNGAAMPVLDSIPQAVDTMTSSGTSAQSSAVSTEAESQFWSVTAADGNVYVCFGANPTAAADSGWLIADGQTREFAACSVGEKIAVKDA